MIGGGSMVNTDVPPFLMTSGYPARYMGLNIVGLKRRGFSIQEIEEIKGAYHIYYNGGLTSQDAKSKIKDSFPSSPYIQMILDFMAKSTRNIIRK
jgi:UDP-N-acetylglucosamine acyltransferase